ncbi:MULTISPECIES: glycosyltransferase [Streptomyces]|uniref:Glycosyltransferase n=2 Tax=Streptomyces TaxID=1883 RepID=A0ABU3JH49_9ACTN|nr:glycosyltransferase [Streptomyces sp. McG7]MDQ0490911.1 glycosyltransferase involved in cell wall biosynthesis [Streptomyces thermodiastaticus]MDT6973373.1 glycosyltransferase [Streptomyces thermocarboxydus]MDX3418808.1 glycosyltransferase [Streptomyces sp. MD20-1-1]MXQ58514.1 glycosyltransferase [Streptomyces sp. XHT-2]MYQ34467.1 glycosyltransferase [Streptomyces sp. SID4956]THC47984.1 glycosyltransferase [Streptomyces sp. Akac8]WSB41515.1 glycosyltransferase [Streptomyces cellulosae]
MRALHIITGLGVGGAEQQLRLLLRHLPVACDVVTLTNPGPVAEGLRADGVRVLHLGMAGNRDVGVLPRLVRVIRSGGYDLVHTHLYRACVYGRLAARMAGVRAVVATEHSLGDSQMEGRALTQGVRALYLASERLGSATVAVSPTVADRLKRWGVPAPRIEVVPNGIELDRFRFDPERRERTRRRLGLPDGAFVVGGVGRLAPGKRFDVLVRALARLPEDCWLLLVGGGPEEHVLRRTAHEAGVSGRVLFTGERPAVPDGTPGPDLPSLTSAMDLFASPSTEEAFGLAAVEALAAGLPVLHGSCPAIEDLPPDASAGARRVRGGPEEYARAIAEVRAAGPAPRTAAGAARHYSITRSSARLMDVYAAAVAGPSPSVHVKEAPSS